jgi:hypothetical protein
MMASRASGPDASVASLSRGAAGGEARGKPGSAAHSVAAGRHWHLKFKVESAATHVHFKSWAGQLQVASAAGTVTVKGIS